MGPRGQSTGQSIDLQFNYTSHNATETEIFNLTNTPPLGTPNGVAGSSAFGSITTAGAPLVVQLGLKLYF